MWPTPALTCKSIGPNDPLRHQIADFTSYFAPSRQHLVRNPVFANDVMVAAQPAHFALNKIA